MKKKYLYLTALAALATACTNETTENIQEVKEEAISIAPYVETSRALDKSFFVVNDAFMVNAYGGYGSTFDQNFASNFMNQELVTKNNLGWGYENPKYWPIESSSKISFVAHYPSSITPTISEGAISYPFTVAASPTVQEDLLWATITDASRSDRNGTYQNGILEEPNTTPISDVLLHFRHALSRIVFTAQAKTYYSNTTITVKEIQVNNVLGAGTYTLTKTLGAGTWAPSGDLCSYKPYTNGETIATNIETKTLGTSLLLIPQVLAKTGENPATVTLKYEVTYLNSSVKDEITKTFSLATSALANGNTWEQNKVYTYNFNIGLDMITFDAAVENWSSSTTSTIETFE